MRCSTDHGRLISGRRRGARSLRRRRSQLAQPALFGRGLDGIVRCCGMFNGFTKEACDTVNVAQEEAAQLGRGYVGTEHIPLGLLRGEDRVAAQVLMSLGITLKAARRHLLKLVPPGEEQKPPDAPGPGPFVRLGRRVLEVPFTPRATLVLEMAAQEALTLGSTSINTEHILLGISREKESLAMRILIELDAELPRTEEEIRPGREFDLEIRNAVIRRLSNLWAQP